MKYYPKLSHDNAPRLILLANGAFPQSLEVLRYIDLWVEGKENFQLLCCDGAVDKLQSYTDKLPDAVVGDLDSISLELKERLQGRIHHFPDQNTNDLTKAVRFATEIMKVRSILLLGASGEREDHFIANIALLPSYADFLDELFMLTDEGYFVLLKGSARLEVAIGQQLSVFNFEATPLTFKGVRWELEETRLDALFAGTLNHAEKEQIFLSSENPILLYIAKEIKS